MRRGGIESNQRLTAGDPNAAQPNSSGRIPRTTWDRTPKPAIDARGTRIEPTAAKQKKQKSSFQEIVETLLMAIVIFLVLHSVILPFRVDGFSMEPTLHDREMLFINRRAYTSIDVNRLLNLLPGVEREGEREWYPFSRPERGDIIVFEPPEAQSEPYIKRIIGLPGDRIAIRDGGVFVNGERLDEPYLRSDTTGRGNTGSEVVVGPGHLFVMGDNRNNSRDSRYFGTVPMSAVIGKAWVAYWPLGEVKIISHPDYDLDR